jgi:hypothetical protein
MKVRDFSAQRMAYSTIKSNVVFGNLIESNRMESTGAKHLFTRDVIQYYPIPAKHGSYKPLWLRLEQCRVSRLELPDWMYTSDKTRLKPADDCPAVQVPHIICWPLPDQPNLMHSNNPSAPSLKGRSDFISPALKVPHLGLPVPRKDAFRSRPPAWSRASAAAAAAAAAQQQQQMQMQQQQQQASASPLLDQGRAAQRSAADAALAATRQASNGTAKGGEGLNSPYNSSVK